MERKPLVRIALLLALLLAAGCLIPGSALGATSVELNRYIQYSMGYSTISWSVTGDDPGDVFVICQQAGAGSDQQYVIFEGPTSRKSIQTNELIPGRTYSVMLINSSFDILAEELCSVPDAGIFEDGRLKNTSVKISTEARKKNQNGKYTKLDYLRASDIMGSLDAGENVYGLKYSMKMPQLAKPRTFMITLAFEAPNGYTVVDKAGDITFDSFSNGYQTIWLELAGNRFFDALYKDTGSIPTGKYEVTLYWDGAWVNTSEFTVR